MAEAVAASAGFEQVITPAQPREAPTWPPAARAGRVEVFDLDKWSHPGLSSAAVGPFLVLCGICTRHPGHYDHADDAERAQRAHYTKHYEAGETS